MSRWTPARRLFAKVSAASGYPRDRSSRSTSTNTGHGMIQTVSAVQEGRVSYKLSK
jgi:hypothetical protein